MTVSHSLFAEPPAVLPRLEDCRFYHSIDLPGYGLQTGFWDLRGRFDEYFGGHDFAGERVLDLGTASGALAFEMERRGAREVVGFDLEDGVVYDCKLPPDRARFENSQAGVSNIKNSFWLAHSALKSRVKAVYGHLNRLPADLGRFDTVMMGNVLQHLQDPVGAVLQAIQYTDHIIITEADWLPGIGDDLPCLVMYDIPNPYSWYQVKPALLQNLLRRWNFTDQTLTRHTQVILQGPQYAEGGGLVAWKDFGIPTNHFTLSARRKG